LLRSTRSSCASSRSASPSRARDLIGVPISDDANDNLSEPGVEVVLSIAHHFFDSTKISDRSLIYSRQIYVFPSLNPDGAEYDIATGSYRFWRKNRQPNAQAVGTDNNGNDSYR
jgi:carboxypeptidase T